LLLEILRGAGRETEGASEGRGLITEMPRLFPAILFVLAYLDKKNQSFVNYPPHSILGGVGHRTICMKVSIDCA